MNSFLCIIPYYFTSHLSNYVTNNKSVKKENHDLLLFKFEYVAHCVGSIMHKTNNRGLKS